MTTDSPEAQKKMYKGARAIHAAVTFLVYRPTPEQLTHACLMLSHSFGSAKVLRERNIAWQLWLETLPITVSWLLHSSSLDLMHDQTSRAVITGESGSGKSVLGWRFAIDALAANIPVVGMDISAGSGSTFETAVKLLGDDGAYYDITKCSSNLLEIPDLRRFAREERSRRLDQWKEFIRKALTIISMGKVHDPKLAQRVDAILLLTLKKFLEDPEIIERYNAAFEKGWKSPEWQEMPTLKNLLKFCTKEQLNLQNFTDFDRIAINQIITQCNALLASPLGKAIGRPSTFSPEPAVKFFALSGLGNEQDQYLMAINAHAACIRNALSHPKSLFIGDELSILFKKDGFAEVVGELCAVGRKNGISVLLLSQDIDSICDCSAGAMIMQNMVYRITGRLTSNGANSWVKRLGYPAEIISQNATEAFLPRTTDLYSNWLIEKGGRFWQSRYYPGEMILASVANNQAELMARNRVMAQYPHTLKGQLLALKQFTSEYVQAVKEWYSLANIGNNPPNSTFNSGSFTVPNQQIENQIQQSANNFLSNQTEIGGLQNTISDITGEISDTVSTISNSISGIWDSLLNKVENFSSEIESTLSSFLGELKVPDLKEAVQSIMNGNADDSEGTKLSAALENECHPQTPRQASRYSPLFHIMKVSQNPQLLKSIIHYF